MHEISWEGHCTLKTLSLYSIVLNILELAYLRQRWAAPNQGRVFIQEANFSICFTLGLSSTDSTESLVQLRTTKVTF